jgi:hypothetical protein
MNETSGKHAAVIVVGDADSVRTPWRSSSC